MYQLSEEQTDIVYMRLQAEGLRNKKLTEDLLDHFCCHVEAQMEEGAGFENAYRNAMKDIYPNGAKEIEFELFFIMNFNKQMSMKRIIFLAGFLAAFLLSTAIMFKTMHWPGATVLLFSGFATLLVTLLSALVYFAKFLPRKPYPFWLRTGVGLASLMLISIGFMFKIMHWPGAGIMYTLGTLVFNTMFLPLFFYYLYKHGFAKTTIDEKA